MTRHALDRPLWDTLSTRQSAFAVGGDRALRFADDVGPLAAAVDDSPASLLELARLIEPDQYIVLLQVGASPIPPLCIAERVAPGVQMVAEHLATQKSEALIEELTDADAADMLALATLTEPGPFRTRTHKLGTFRGIRQNGKLVAMAGERMKLDGYTELSGVCTHPDYRGRGYGAMLSQAVATRIRDRGEIPFLHAYAGNAPAIALYETLGFVLRTPMCVTVLRRAPGQPSAT